MWWSSRKMQGRVAAIMTKNSLLRLVTLAEWDAVVPSAAMIDRRYCSDCFSYSDEGHRVSCPRVGEIALLRRLIEEYVV